MCVFHLGLLFRCADGFFIDDAKADALRLRGENPAEGVSALRDGDRDDAVAAGPDEELARGIAELLDLADLQQD